MAREKMQYRGVNHVALVARDMAETVEFYEKILEMPLVKTVELSNGRGQHFFFDAGGNTAIAYFWFPDAPPAAPGIASYPLDPKKAGSTRTAHASMHHLAIDIPIEKFDEYVDRLRAKGLAVIVKNHDDSPAGVSEELHPGVWIRSMYFRDPNGIYLELAALTRAYNEEDVRHEPLNARGERVSRARKLEPAE